MNSYLATVVMATNRDVTQKNPNSNFAKKHRKIKRIKTVTGKTKKMHKIIYEKRREIIFRQHKTGHYETRQQLN